MKALLVNHLRLGTVRGLFLKPGHIASITKIDNFKKKALVKSCGVEQEIHFDVINRVFNLNLPNIK